MVGGAVRLREEVVQPTSFVAVVVVLVLVLVTMALLPRDSGGGGGFGDCGGVCAGCVCCGRGVGGNAATIVPICGCDDRGGVVEGGGGGGGFDDCGGVCAIVLLWVQLWCCRCNSRLVIGLWYHGYNGGSGSGNDGGGDVGNSDEIVVASVGWWSQIIWLTVIIKLVNL
ncbi:Hypothetical predicted protein [Olea europaea subsp. europaea]|uniref:Uncharacterized protein n=1 Tax=Olea europaea subsp. europaea TaxID=158383 RepID=A0A8S0U3P8_OLEEU|nr:Hypothetical predicted protein [Olea europaea subsp. europaea]